MPLIPRCSWLAVTVVVMLLVALWPGAALAEGHWRYFPETGCWVGNEFLDFFDKRGGLDIFGYPIDNASTEDGLSVQYFQRARMELHPEQPEPYRVQLGLLGQELRGSIDPPVPANRMPAAGDRNHRYFPETGQVVSFAFLDFFNTRGGVDIFGYPISAQAVENGVVVQYFQRARMEWRPENAPRYRVQLGLLGQEAYTRRYGAHPTPAPTPTGLATPTRPAAPPATPQPAPPRVAATATTGSGALAPTAAPSAPAPAGQANDVLTLSHLIMFVVTFVVVVLVGLAVLWKRGALQDWLAHRGGGPPAGSPPSATSEDGKWGRGGYGPVA